MSRTTNTEAIVLRNDPLNGSDARLSFFTSSHGKIEAIAKGLQKATSKLAAHLDPITKVELFFIEGRRRRLVGGSIVENRFPVIRADLQRLFAAGLVVRLADKMAPYENTDEVAFRLVESALFILDSKKCPTELVSVTPYFFAWKLLMVSGYHPQLTQCLSCNKPIVHGTVVLVPRQGGVLHRGCRQQNTNDAVVLLQTAALKGLAYMIDAPLTDVIRLRAANSVFLNIRSAIEQLMEERFDISRGNHFWRTAL